MKTPWAVRIFVRIFETLTSFLSWNIRAIAEPAILGYTYIDDASLTLNQRRRFEKAPSLREDFLVKTDDEVRRDIFKKISGLKDPILGNILQHFENIVFLGFQTTFWLSTSLFLACQLSSNAPASISVFISRLKPFLFSVVFKNQKCLDCGLTGDVRLMSNYCHMEKVFVHPGSLIQYHPKRTERYHDSTTVIREHPGGLYRPWYSLDFFICKMGGERWDSRGYKQGNKGWKSQL